MAELLNIGNIPILHVDGSVADFIDQNGNQSKIVGVGGFFKNTKYQIKFSKHFFSLPFPDAHEFYAVLEGLCVAKRNNIKAIKVMTDSVETINLFGYSKRIHDDRDYFFLSMFLPVSQWFEYIDFEYYQRDKSDLAHNLSREYLKQFNKRQLQLPSIPIVKCANDQSQYYDIMKNFLNKFFS